jgi:protease YdgD
LHCIIEVGVVDSNGVFNVGEYEARIIDHFHDPTWGSEEPEDGNREGRDWVLLRLDQPLGEEVGYVGVAAPDNLLERELYQGGFSWDTGTHLSGNLRCRAVEIHPESDTMAHECDTTRGDSGSPFLIQVGEDWFVVATDSRFESNKAGPMRYIAALSSAWVDYYDEFVLGELSSRPPPAEGKPGGKFPGKGD